QGARRRTVKGPADRVGYRAADRLPGQVVLEGEATAGLDEDPGVDDFPDRVDEVGDWDAGHRRDLAERELASERGGDGHASLARGSGARQAAPHAVLEPV